MSHRRHARGRGVKSEVETPDVDLAYLAVPRDSAARISGLSRRQVDYWAASGLLEPSTDERVSPGRRVRLYDFVDLLGLMVAAELKARKVSLQHIRAIVTHLKSRGYEQPLTQVTFATIGNRVYFQHDDGSWESDVQPDQLVFREVLDLRPLRNRIMHATRRDEQSVGHTERRRGTLGHKELIAGTRIPVDTVRRYIDAGRTMEQILISFPALSAADVEAVREAA